MGGWVQNGDENGGSHVMKLVLLSRDYWGCGVEREGVGI